MNHTQKKDRERGKRPYVYAFALLIVGVLVCFLLNLVIGSVQIPLRELFSLSLIHI